MLRTVGSTIRELRKNKNLTQEELAEAINVTPQAISKWENNIGLPDISQIIPLATFFGVSTDIILGIAENNRNEEIKEILNACNERKLKKDDINSWLLIQETIKKYPSNLDLLQESIEYGIALSYKGNYCYNEEYAERIYKETTRQAELIIKYSSNATNILRAHMIMVMLHSSFGDAESAVKHANEFPWRADMTVHAMCAWINKAFNEFEIEKINLQRDLEQHMHSSINTLGLLGISYENTKNYDEALKMYFTILNIINEVFKEDDYVPALYRLEMGNLYAMIARTYLEMENIDECLNYLEQMVDVEIYHNKVKVKEFKIKNKYLDKSGTYNYAYADYRAFDKDSDVLCSLDLECFHSIKDNEKYKEIVDKAKNHLK
ncbi:MAG: helix-turn-helix domain-containing protein [Bacilli bacterium]|nr:helix-turn-helix domain-containing protein [Bacilli bacterium]